MKLNCDMGESFGAWQMGNDQAVMPWIDMANIACGFHASDPDIMAQTVSWALSHRVEIGAHPGYEGGLWPSQCSACVGLDFPAGRLPGRSVRCYLPAAG